MTRRQKDLFPEMPDGKKYLSDIPELMAEWHPTKNEGVAPEDVPYGAGTKLWWRCEKGHEWQTSPNNRTNHNTNCPICYDKNRSDYSRRANAAFNLLIAHPALCSEWHPTRNEHSPEYYMPKSNDKVWWRCSQGHVWETAIYHRTSGTGCPYCNGKQPSSSNNFGVMFPTQAGEWHPTKNNSFEPKDFTAGSGKKAWWLCSKGHEWEATISSRQRNGCPYCSNLYVSEGSSLLDLNPTVCLEWDYEKNDTKPSDYNPKSGKKVWWRCSEGEDHVWEARIASRAAPEDGILSGCPFCAGRKPSKGYNLAVAYPELLKEWDYSKNKKPPENYVPKSNYKVWWKCLKGHEWQSQINNRTNGRNCPECNIKSSRAEMRILTELMTCYPNVMSRKKVEGFEVDIFLPDLAIGIEYDGSYWHSEKQDYDLKKQRALEAAGVRLLRVREKPLTKLSPDDIIVERVEELEKGTVNKLLSLIAPNHHTTIDYLSKADWMNDDLYKSYLDNFPSPLPENSLAENNPSLCVEWHPTKNIPLSPKNFTPNSGQKVWWLCSMGHEWEATIDSRNSSQRPSGCPYCSPTRKLASDENNMAETRPDVAQYFHPTKNGKDTPEKLVEGTGKMLWWQCELGHEWQQRGYAMLKTKGHLCPMCRKTK